MYGSERGVDDAVEESKPSDTMKSLGSIILFFPVQLQNWTYLLIRKRDQLKQALGVLSKDQKLNCESSLKFPNTPIINIFFGDEEGTITSRKTEEIRVWTKERSNPEGSVSVKYLLITRSQFIHKKHKEHWFKYHKLESMDKLQFC